MYLKTLSLLALALLAASCSDSPHSYKLPGGATIIEPYSVPTDCDTAVLVIPGGGYNAPVLSEGMFDWSWLRTNGVRVFIVSYRPNPYPIALNDCLEAWTFIHSTTTLRKFGLLGASVGGHLEALVTVRTQFKPDFSIYIYPLITMSKEGLVNLQCFVNMTGRMDFKPGEADIIALDSSAERQFTLTNLSPTFVAHNRNDNVVSAGNSLLLVNALDAAHIPYELHLYWSKNNEHGMDKPLPPWTDNCVRFMRLQKFIH